MRPFTHGFKMKPRKAAGVLPSSPRPCPHPTVTQLLDTKKFCPSPPPKQANLRSEHRYS